MTGVDILAMEEVAVEWAFNWTAFWITVVILGAIGLIHSIYSVVEGIDDWVYIPIMTTVFMLIGAMVGTLFGGALCRTPTKYEPQYKVTVSDDVSMTEFLERYEIIDTEGKIYTVRERGENNEE